MKTWLICRVFNHHKWRLIEEYKPMMTATFVGPNGYIEQRVIPNPFKQESIQGKWKCQRCNQVSVGTLPR